MVDIFGDDDARETGWDIVTSDTTGPNRPLNQPSDAALRLHQTGRSYIPDATIIFS